MTPPNLLTILRIILSPLFVVLVVAGEIGAAVVVFLLAGVTDLLDGLVARWFNFKSSLGTVLDPIADKLLLVSSFLVLSFGGTHLTTRIPAWLALTVIGRDVLLITSVIVINLFLGKHLFPPSMVGKWATTLQLATVLAVLLCNFWEFDMPGLQLLFYVTLALTVLSGLHYLSRVRGLLEYDRKGIE